MDVERFDLPRYLSVLPLFSEMNAAELQPAGRRLPAAPPALAATWCSASGSRARSSTSP